MNPCEYSRFLEPCSLQLLCTQKEARCSYHKKGQVYKLSDLAPDGLCQEAYHNLYYLSLGLLFNAKFAENKLIVKCPSAQNYVVFKAGFTRLNVRFRLINILKRLLYWLYPGQIYRGNLYWEIIKIEGKCPRGHMVGSRFYINKGNFQITKNFLLSLGEPHGLCPAVFDNLFPYLHTRRLEKEFPYSTGVIDYVHCPDHKANITFEITEKSS